MQEESQDNAVDIVRDAVLVDDRNGQGTRREIAREKVDFKKIDKPHSADTTSTKRYEGMKLILDRITLDLFRRK